MGVIAIGFIRRPIARTGTGRIPDAGSVFCAALIIDARFEIMLIASIAFGVIFGVNFAIRVDIIGKVYLKRLGGFSRR